MKVERPDHSDSHTQPQDRAWKPTQAADPTENITVVPSSVIDWYPYISRRYR